MSIITRNNIIVAITAIIISTILSLAHILLPFMFGPILAAILCIKVFKLEIKWPFWLSEIGIVVLGVQIGASFTKNVILDIKDDWGSIVLVTLLLLTLALIMAMIFKRIAKINSETALLSVIPGALSQMLVMAEQNKKANLLVVSLTQTSRIIFVVVLVPLISYFFSDSGEAGSNQKVAPITPLTEALQLWQIGLLAVAIVAIYFIMVKINFPTYQLLGPIIVLIIWNLTTGLTFKLDDWILNVAQLIYMIRIGVQIAHLLGDLKGRIAIAIAFQNIMLILGSFVMVCVVHLFNHIPINELFLGAAPGGVNQIVLVAIATGADVAMISSYHIFRIFFILFIIAPIINYILHYRVTSKK